MRYFIGLFLIITSANLKAETWGCVHPQTCEFIRQAGHEPKKLFDIPNDLHHFRPRPNQIKMLINEANLVIGPREIFPWAHKVLKQRQGKKSFQIKTIKADYKLYKDRHALGHFWLYPDIYCRNLKSFKGKEIAQCNEDFNHSLDKVQDFILIFDHDAIVPYLKNMGLRALSFKSSHHHSRVSMSKLKEITKMRKSGEKFIWVRENKIALPSKIKKNYFKEGDLVIEWNQNQQDSTELFAVIKNLFHNLDKVIGK